MGQWASISTRDENYGQKVVVVMVVVVVVVVDSLKPLPYHLRQQLIIDSPIFEIGQHEFEAQNGGLANGRSCYLDCSKIYNMESFLV